MDSDTRFSDVFRALIGKGCFADPLGERPVWVLLYGDQDLNIWDSSSNTFFDRFPFGEPPIARLPVWSTRAVHFTSSPAPLVRTNAIYLYFEGPKSFIGNEGFLREYKNYQATAAQEVLWQAECNDNR